MPLAFDPKTLTAFLVRFKPVDGFSGYNTVYAKNRTQAWRVAEDTFGKYGVLSVELPKPGEVEALDALWSSLLG